MGNLAFQVVISRDLKPALDFIFPHRDDLPSLWIRLWPKYTLSMGLANDKAFLDPKETPFLLGFLIMISLYTSFKRVGSLGSRFAIEHTLAMSVERVRRSSFQGN